jgi:acyl-CoA thioester hydrolase
MHQTSTPIELRFSDLDVYGHVNSAVYFTYLETARVKLLQTFFQEGAHQGHIKLVARAECVYKCPILLHDELVVTLWVSRVGRSSFDLEYRLHNSREKTFATARTTMVCFDTRNNITVPVPESIRLIS